MGTPNFARPSNASKYFVVLANREENYSECDECGEKHFEWEEEYVSSEGEPCTHCGSEDITFGEETVYPDDFEADDLIENLGYEIKAIGGTKENESIGNDRSYGIQSVGYIKKTKMYGDVAVTVKVVAVIQSAYYEGATLDYLIYVEDDNGEDFKYSTGSSYDEDTDDILELLFDVYYSDMNKGLCQIMKPKAKRFIEDAVEELSEQIEKIFEQFSEHKLQCTAVFSNGEAIYESVN